ncbi:hypothetical protein CONPUDRAFT_125823 [Coniophora puteana RWD-64-598 SS2]|uniref:Copper-fist domain-containing protein n=1 Tax=Coniophora puteana (strain RWD-64-598) TaxID=741705 RepID=A0A5M3MJV7_CONPW|nr:uncharacterized protein CONPUDRAFT_125823 [Coniophora puteana RWD-64-598 SS2]EIW79508.1 hypothetical protein CONPUDRAFT_125823 [Coniophora puteana RWD-64-598 SS2]
MRCDGTRPVCGQCTRGNRSEDCEYTDGQRPSRTQTLENDVARLQARIQELENPGASAPSVTLHNPYAGSTSAHAVPRLSIPTSASPIASTSSSESYNVYATPQTSQGIMPMEEPPYYLLRAALESTIPMSRAIGFFFNVDRFRLAVTSASGTARPSPVLLNVITLWHIQVTQAAELAGMESLLLPRVLQQLPDTIANALPEELLFVLQTELILAHYFLRIGRYLEARYHANAATSLALSMRLHRQGSIDPPNMFTYVGSLQNCELPEANDAIEEGERITAWWNVFTLDQTLSVVLSVPPTIPCTRLSVTTPWPLDMTTYERSATRSPGYHGRTATPGSIPSHTDVLRAMLAHSDNAIEQTSSIAGLNAKAAALLAHASSVSSRFTIDPRIAQNPDFRTQHTALSNLIERFHQALPPLSDETPPEIMRSLLVIYVFTNLAAVQLHHAFRDVLPSSAHLSSNAAHAVIGMINNANARGIRFFNPILQIMYSAVVRQFGS